MGEFWGGGQAHGHTDDHNTFQDLHTRTDTFDAASHVAQRRVGQSSTRVSVCKFQPAATDRPTRQPLTSTRTVRRDAQLIAMVAYSDNDGLTWSELEDIRNLGSADKARAGPGLALLIEQGRATGRVLVPASTGTYGSDWAYVTDDEGRNFRAAGIQKPGMDEAQATQLPNGQLLMIMRHTEEGSLGKAATTSDDGGSTWSPIKYLSELKILHAYINDKDDG